MRAHGRPVGVCRGRRAIGRAAAGCARGACGGGIFFRRRDRRIGGLPDRTACGKRRVVALEWAERGSALLMGRIWRVSLVRTARRAVEPAGLREAAVGTVAGGGWGLLCLGVVDLASGRGCCADASVLVAVMTASEGCMHDRRCDAGGWALQRLWWSLRTYVCAQSCCRTGNSK